MKAIKALDIINNIVAVALFISAVSGNMIWVVASGFFLLSTEMELLYIKLTNPSADSKSKSSKINSPQSFKTGGPIVKVQCSKYPEEKCKRYEDKDTSLCEFCSYNNYLSKAAINSTRRDWSVSIPYIKFRKDD